MYDVTNYHFNKEECWFKPKCPYYNGCKCNCGCGWYTKFYYLVNLANLPKALTYPENQQMNPGKDANEHKYLEGIKDNIVEWVEQGNNLLLYSANCGNGKTTWAIKMMCKYFSEIVFYQDYDYECRGLFVNVDDFLYQHKQNINHPDERFHEIMLLIDHVDLVVWDDIGNSKLSKYEYDIIYRCINNRINNGKANIFTSNVIDGDMDTNLGYRLSDRIINTSDIIEFINPSQRQPKSRRK